MKNFSEIRQEIYRYNFSTAVSDHGVDLRNWKRNPYTCFKSRFYIEASAVLVFILSRTSIRPNMVTLIYALCGVIGGTLLSIPNKTAILIALSIFFSKGVLDWSDGALARMKDLTSAKGAVLDSWGALINSLGFQMGLGFYVAMRSGHMIYFYLITIIIALRAADIRHFTYQHFSAQFIDGSTREDKAELKTKVFGASQHEQRTDNPSGWLMGRLRGFLDDRARSVDFICLFILIEVICPRFFMTWLFVWALLIRHLLIFLRGIYLVFRENWIEDTKESFFK